MGIEFLRNASGKPYTKRWARGVDRIKAPTRAAEILAIDRKTLREKLKRYQLEGPGSGQEA